MNKQSLASIILLALSISMFYGNKAFSSSLPVADKILAVVGEPVLLKSELETQLLELKRMEQMPEDELRCLIFENMLQQKLMLNKAMQDSIDVTDEQVNNELNRRMRHFVQQFGSERVIEDYFGYTIEEMKEQFRDDIREQLIIMQIEQRIQKDVDVSPAEVRRFFNSIPPADLPYYNTEVEVAQIVKLPEVSEDQKRRTRERLNEFRRRVVEDGESFETLAILYSQDQGSARRGGDIGMISRNQLEAPYASAAMSLQPGQVSNVVETRYGFHIIKLEERRGERIHTRHILLKPEVTPESRVRARESLDSLRNSILLGTISFSDAAMRHSDDEATKNSGGILADRETGSTRREVDKLDPDLFFAIDTLQVGQVTGPFSFTARDGTRGFRIVKLNQKLPPHRANLKDDYPRIREMALEDKKQRVKREWIEKNIHNTYIRIDEAYKAKCPDLNSWLP